MIVMKLLRVGLVVILIIVSAILVSSWSVTPTVGQITVQDCAFTAAQDGSYTLPCGTTATYTCFVQDRISGGDVSVSYTFKRKGGNEQTVQATLLSGTMTDGYWSASVPVSVSTNPQTDDYIELVKVRVSEPQAVCEQNSTSANPTTTSRCYMRRLAGTEGTRMTVSCTCGSFASFGQCTPYDNRSVSFSTNDPACGTQTGIVADVCDYCDPQWLGWYQQGCVLDGGSPDMSGNGTMEFVHAIGTSPNGQFCCGLSQSGGRLNHNGNQPASDCEPPVVSGSQACEMDAWLGRGKSSDGNNVVWAGGNNAFRKLTPSFFKMNAVLTGTDKIQPLIDDLEGDGISEIFVYQGNKVYSYSVKKDLAGSSSTNPIGSLALENTVTPSADISYFFGQPSIVGMDYKFSTPNLAGEYTCYSDSGNYPPCTGFGGRAVAIFAKNATDGGEMFCLLKGTDFSIVNCIRPTVTDGVLAGRNMTISEDSGIMCEGNDGILVDDWSCYFTGSITDVVGNTYLQGYGSVLHKRYTFSSNTDVTWDDDDLYLISANI